MNAITFFSQFGDEVKETVIYDDGRSYFEIYKNDEPTFTKIINKIVVPKIIKSDGLECQNEYFRIDTIGWKAKYQKIPEDRAKRIGMIRHLWDLKIAVEHENDKSDWTDELIKLAHIRCPLKVVIGYVHCDERNEIEAEKLRYAYDCLKQINAFDLYANEEFLIVLGNGAPHKNKKDTYNKFDYRAYLLSKEEKRFIEMRTER